MATNLTEIAVFVGACSGFGYTLDFLLGKSGQEKLKDRLSTWWIKFDDVKLRTFARDEAAIAHNILQRLYGKFISLRRLNCIVAATLSGALLWFILGLLGSKESAYPNSIFQEFVLDPAYRAVAIFRFVFGLLALSAALSVTSWFALFLSRRLPTSQILNVIGILFLLYIQLSLISLTDLLTYWGASLVFDEKEFEIRVVYDTLFLVWHTFWNVDYAETVNHIWYSLTKVKDGAIGFINYISIIYLLLPSLLRLAILFIFLLSIALKPIQKAILLFWARLIEQEKPVFTILFSAFSALGKLIEVVAK